HRAATLQPLGHTGLRDALRLGRNPGPAEVFLCQDIYRHLGPMLRRPELFHLEDDGAIRVGDARAAAHKREGAEGILSFARELRGDLHGRFRKKGETPALAAGRRQPEKSIYTDCPASMSLLRADDER